MSESPRRYDGIDILRGVSILAVVVHHIHLRFLFNHVSWERLLPPWAPRILFWNGANGVTVFFAISGFLITSMSLRRWGALGRISPRAFYRLRFARIAPLLLALLVVLIGLHLGRVEGFVIAADRASLPRATFAALTFHVNWLEAAHGYLPGNWDVLWSLSVEEVFYLFFPLLCIATRTRSILFSVLCIVVMTGPFARVYTKNQLWADYGYLSCMDGIALGCLAALVAPELRKKQNVLRAMRAVGIALMLLVLAGKPLARAMHLYATGLDFTALALGTALLLVPISVGNVPGGWRSAPLRWLGRNSYEIYLTHMFVLMFGIRFFLWRNWTLAQAPLFAATELIVCALLGGAIARWYSEPLNRRLRAQKPTTATAIAGLTGR